MGDSYVWHIELIYHVDMKAMVSNYCNTRYPLFVSPSFPFFNTNSVV